MSGIEIAGLVLGALPVLLRACDICKGGFKGLEGWIEFRSRFEDFAFSLETERQCYRTIVIDLLCLGPDPFFATIDDASALLNDPNSGQWSSEELKSKLKHRLDDRYSLCMATIDKIRKVIEELYPLLEIQEGQLDAKPHSSRWWQEKLYRTKFSFSTKRVLKVQQLQKYNQSLERMLRATDRLEPLRESRYTTTFVTFLDRFRSSACSLYTAIKNGWGCNCSTPHTTKLRLENRATPEQATFTFLFEDHSVRPRPCKLSIEPQSIILEAQKPLPSSENAKIIDSPKSLAALPTRMSTKKPARTIFKAPGSLLQPSKKLRAIRFAADLDSPTLSPKTSIMAPAVTGLNIPAKSTTRKVDDLCGHLGGLNSTQCATSYISDDQNRQHILRSLTGLETEDVHKATLQSLLSRSEGAQISKRQRIIIASVMASSLLQLQQTPWALDIWQKTDIRLLYSKGILIEEPYIAKDFLSSKISQKPSEIQSSIPIDSADIDHFDTPLIRLGILLLELCFGETIESRSRQHPQSTKYFLSKSLMHYSTALEWSQEVENDYPDLSDPIKRCLRESLGEKIDWNNPKFQQNAYMNIVKPLQDSIVKMGWAK